jgi:hypothetical protein
MSERDEGKIALEEHFYLPSFEAYGADGSALDGAGKAHNYEPEYFASVQKRLGDVKLQLEDMDRCGIERMVLSLTQPGIQGISDRAIAVDTAKRHCQLSPTRNGVRQFSVVTMPPNSRFDPTPFLDADENCERDSSGRLS